MILVCKSDSFPPVINWLWYKESESGDQVITNSTQSKFFVVSSESRTELHIPNVDLKEDPGKYGCNGTSLEGTSQAAITLRVRNRFAALWPFLGIVAEVLVLVTIIFIYEKRRKPDEVLDGEPVPQSLHSLLGGGPWASPGGCAPFPGRESSGPGDLTSPLLLTGLPGGAFGARCLPAGVLQGTRPTKTPDSPRECACSSARGQLWNMDSDPQEGLPMSPPPEPVSTALVEQGLCRYSQA